MGWDKLAQVPKMSKKLAGSKGQLKIGPPKLVKAPEAFEWKKKK